MIDWRRLLRSAWLGPLLALGALYVLFTLLAPDTRALGAVYLEQLQGAVMGAPLPLSQSLAIVWPQAVALIAGVLVLFVGGYIVFQRQEVRA